MPKRFARLLFIAPLLLSGCVVRSLCPIYTQDDLIAVHAIEGSWSGDNGEKIVFTRNGDGYDFSYSKGEESLTTEAHFARIGNYTYMDLTLSDESLAQFDKKTRKAVEGVMSFTVPVHAFYQIDVSNHVIRIRAMNYAWAKERREKKRLWIGHVPDGDSTLLTARTERVQRFLRRWENDKEAWGDWNEVPLTPAEAPAQK